MTQLTVTLLCIIAGTILGTLHFGTLKWNTRLYMSGPAWKALAVHLGRFVVLIPALVLIARLGAVPLLAATVGLLIARWWLTRPERTAA